MTTATRSALARDPLLPERDRLLDPRQFARLAVALGATEPLVVDRCERVKAKYRIGESLRVLYRVWVNRAWHLVAARMFAAGRGQEVYRRATETAVPAGPIRPVGYDASLDTVCWAFPNDRKIANLSVLAGPSRVGDARLDGRWITSRVVAYAPERAATAQCLGPRAQVLGYAKVYANDDGQRSVRTHRDLLAGLPAECPDLRLPGVLAYAAEYRMLIVEPIEGRQFAALDRGEWPNGFRRLGSALARLHTLPVPEVPRFTRLDPAHLRQAAFLIARVRPEAAGLADRVALALSERWRAPVDSPVTLHGDVNSRNWLLHGDRVGLIDLDQVSLGPAAADLGGALAGLRYRSRTGELSIDAGRTLRHAVLEGYASVRPLPTPEDLRWHAAAALLVERALRAVTRIRPEGLTHLDGLLAEAVAVLTERDDA